MTQKLNSHQKAWDHISKCDVCLTALKDNTLKVLELISKTKRGNGN